MVLSHDLISQFVQATKDEPTEVKESVVYGTVQEDTHYVKLDGSDILTPVSTTTVVGAGDRVTVMIKNHTATITGNVSNPSARQIDTLSVDKLDAIYGEIDTLVAANAKIQENLEANYLTTQQIEANYITAEEIEAKYVKAEDIEAEYITADKINSTYATIESLDVLKESVNLLNADIANIDTLMFGSASGDVIQTSFANAVIAQLGNAQIKSAMIESVSAGKITSGDIITNNVRVMSEDGSLVISDETLQISDGTRVRVQIGKDAANDYSINIWDQSGNLMFSKGGITDAAIKEAIIRNDMVSDTANIHASKLDIDSLFGEINGSTNTIKSTKVKLDEEGQTLDVAFESLSNTVTSQGETITSQGTAISTMQGQISSKIWQQDINTATDEMSTRYSILEQEVDSFKTTVSETYATVSDLDSIEIGGRNYIQLKKLLSYTPYNSTPIYNGTVITTVRNSSSNSTLFTLSVDGFTPLNDVYTLSGYIKVNGSIPESNYFTSRINTYGSNETRRIYDPETGYFEFTQTYTDQEDFIIHAVTAETNASGSTVTFDKLKFEKGNKATDWTPAPEDVDSEITVLGARVSSSESSITQLSDRITANVTETTNLGTRMSTVEQTADGLTAKIDTLDIGGRNLVLNTSFKGMTNTENVTFSTTERMLTCTSTELGGSNSFHMTMSRYGLRSLRGRSITLSGEYMVESEITYGTTDPWLGLDMPVRRNSTTGGATQWFNWLGGKYIDNSIIGKWIKVSETYIIDDFDVYSVSMAFILRDFIGTVKFRNFKIELGNKATDWTPAPEDVESDILDASKTATNYMNFSSNGLVIGDMTASTLGKNVLIDSNSVRIRTGTTDNAVFGADIIELAKDNESATISMLNGAFKIYYDSDISDGGFGVYGKDQNGNDILAFQPVNENGNLTLGWGHYINESGNTNVYGNDVQIGVKVLKGFDKILFRPYYRSGDSFETEWYGAGFVSSSSKIVYFSIPLAKPIVGNPTVTVTNASSSGGLQIRQDANYVFGSTSSSKVAPSSYSAKVVGDGNFVQIEATMANTTNAVNNAPCGINANIKITFS